MSKRRKIIIVDNCFDCPNSVFGDNTCDTQNSDEPYDIPDSCTLRDYDYVEVPR